MDYYEKRQRANKMIDEMVEEGKPEILIAHKISCKFGFTQKFVNQRLEALKELSKVLSAESVE